MAGTTYAAGHGGFQWPKPRRDRAQAGVTRRTVGGRTDG
jgi:hypothetical protein